MARSSWCSKSIAPGCSGTRRFSPRSLRAAGFTQSAEARAACLSEPTRFDAALLCAHQHNMTACLEHATMLQTCIPGLRVILATRSAGEWSAPALAEAGITEIIHLPVSSVELAGALARCVSGGAGESRPLHNARDRRHRQPLEGSGTTLLRP